MNLMDIVTELLEDTPENRPQSPRSRPAEKPANTGLSPQSPQSLLGRVKTEKKAQGYGRAGCGGKVYTAAEIWVSYALPETEAWDLEHSLVQGWRCDQCGGEFRYVGGSRGPQPIN
jgi:hypothetical protein